MLFRSPLLNVALHLGAAFFLLLPLAYVTRAQTPTVGADSLPAIPMEIIDTWKKAGASYHSGIVLIDGEKRRATPPLFRIPLQTRGDEARWKDGKISKLPAPQAPFGLALNASFRAVDPPLKDSFLQDLAGLEHLEYLSISCGDVTNEGLKALVPLQGLRTLHFSNTQIGDGGMKHVGALTNLMELDLRESVITDVGIAELAPLKRLESLNLTSTQVTGRGLGNLHGLKNLNLESARINDAGVADFASLPELQIINLNGTDVTGAGLERMTTLQSLSILSPRSELSVSGVKELATLEKLKTLSIGKLTDAHLQELATMTGLKSLFLSDCRVTDAGLKHLTAMTGLEKLSLWGCPVTDAGLKHIAALKGVQGLYLTHCPEITGKGLSALVALPRLQSLQMSQVSIGAEGIEALNSLPMLDELWLLNNDKGLTVQDLAKLASAKKLRSLHVNGFSDAEMRELKRSLQKVKVN